MKLLLKHLLGACAVLDFQGGDDDEVLDDEIAIDHGLVTCVGSPLLWLMADDVVMRSLDINALPSHALSMRTTINIDDDVLLAAKSLAQASGKPLGAILSDLARRGLQPRETPAGSFPTFRVSPKSPIVTPEQIRRALEDEL